MDLTDKQWALVAPLIPDPPRRDDGKGRPWRPAREVLNGILWILRTAAPWADLPRRYPPYQTCHRRFQQWVRDGVFEAIAKTLAEDLHQRGELDLRECYIDGMFIVAKKKDGTLERPSAARGARSWPWQTALAFLSPYTYHALHLMRSPLLRLYSESVSQWLSQYDWSEIEPMTLTD